ncbi:small ubiquitin-related modifier 2 isoform X2 [Mastacembelus armatus]|uniref:small ubiquitin-related modifier 2 isoform X2 n=1 Tax=Mastacembelus armatus TaxID=205130 RepID=UPI000E454F6D|nr:small ubiquitin-related modifier 2 isoform X2 [Mastacembelus armatus]
MADEKPKEAVKTENNEHINLKVAGQDGSVVQFKIKRHTPLIKLMKAYCERLLNGKITVQYVIDNKIYDCPLYWTVDEANQVQI